MRAELTRLGLKPRKWLGQNFLLDRSVARRLIEYAQLSGDDTVLEIGAGTGALTEAIAKTARRVIAVERDPSLASFLRKKFSGRPKVEVLEGDFLKLKLPKFEKVISTPPYSISSKIILTLVKLSFGTAVLTLQCEFADRLAAPPGSSDYGRLSVIVQSSARVELLDVVRRASFYPKPKVDSRIVRITRDHLSEDLASYDVFSDLVRGVFNQRRRMVRVALRHYLRTRYPSRAENLLSMLIVPTARVFEMEPIQFIQLSNSIYRSLNN